MSTAFDTLAFANRLETAGMNRKQSEAMATAVQEIVMADIATKSDLRDAVHTLTVRGFTAAVAIVGLVAALVKLL